MPWRTQGGQRLHGSSVMSGGVIKISSLKIGYVMHNKYLFLMGQWSSGYQCLFS